MPPREPGEQEPEYTNDVLAAALLPLVLVAPPPAEASLPARIRRIVLHVPGGPSYERPERRWVFFTPARTQAFWKPRFGTHWIIWTDGSLWPRHPALDEPASVVPPADQPADSAWRARIARSAAPRYAHLHDGNSNTVGIEVSHSGRTASRSRRSRSAASPGCCACCSTCRKEG